MSTIQTNVDNQMPQYWLEAERWFRRRLTALLQVSMELSGIEDLDELCRRAVELGRERLNFDRLGIWFLSEESGVVTGSFSTDEQGRTRDERGQRSRVAHPNIAACLASEKPGYVCTGVPICKNRHEAVAEGTPLVAALWDGRKVIGCLAADNLLTHRAVTERDGELLALYTSTFSHLFALQKSREMLRRTNDELESRVQERTAELREINARLEKQISERQQAERALAAEHNLLRTLVDHLPNPVFVKDRESRFVFANATCVRALGVDSPEALLGKTDRDFLPCPRADFHRAEELQIMETGLPMIDYEIPYQDESGQNRWTINTKVPWRDQEGNIIGTVGLNYDITERKLAEERVRQHQEMLAHVSRLSTAGEMAAGLAHELNQPLAAIINYARGCIRRLKPKSPQNAELREAMGQVVLQAERAGEIIRRLRNFVRPKKTTLAEIRLDEAIRGAVGFLEHEIRRWGAIVKVEVSPTLPPVPGDLIQIEQVIVNLVRNSLEATGQLDKASRRVTIQASLDPSGLVEVRISDPGCGIEPELLDKVFGPFFTTKPEGMGVGLSISRSIIEAHGGRLWATRPDGPGIDFHFTLPVCDRGAV